MIITEAILYFLLVGEASKSIDLALQVCFVVGVEQVIVSVYRSLVGDVLCIGVGNDCMEYWFERGLL